MSDRHPDNPEALFLEHLGWIDRVAAVVCAKEGIWGAEAEDFASQARIRLMEDDYAVLRRFRGESEVKTYIATVVTRYFVSHIRSRQGQWRASAAAERLGELASDLERLVHRESYTVQQAGEKLRTAGRTTLSDAELARLLARLPARSLLRPVELESESVLDITGGGFPADDRVVAEESRMRRREVMTALDKALEELDPEDLLIVNLHFRDGFTVADVARSLGLEQKPLYRRLDRLRARLRTLLESAGLREDDVQSILFDTETS